MNNLNKILKHIRIFNHTTQLELAENLGMSRSYISEIESGKKTPSLEVLEKYSVAFKIPLSAIILFAENYDKKVGLENIMKKNLAGATLKFLNWIVKI